MKKILQALLIGMLLVLTLGACGPTSDATVDFGTEQAPAAEAPATEAPAVSGEDATFKTGNGVTGPEHHVSWSGNSQAESDFASITFNGVPTSGDDYAAYCADVFKGLPADVLKSLEGFELTKSWKVPFVEVTTCEFTRVAKVSDMATSTAASTDTPILTPTPISTVQPSVTMPALGGGPVDTSDPLGNFETIGGSTVPVTVSGGMTTTEKSLFHINPETGWVRLVTAENGEGAAHTVFFRINSQDPGVNCFFPHPWEMSCTGTGTVDMSFMADSSGYWDSVPSEERTWADSACANPGANTGWVNCPGLAFWANGSHALVTVAYPDGQSYPAYNISDTRPGVDLPLFFNGIANPIVNISATLDDGLFNLPLGNKVETGDLPYHP